MTLKRLHFLSLLLREHLGSYVLGALLLAGTMWMTLTIPVYLEESIDALTQYGMEGKAVFMSRVLSILGFAVCIIFVRTGSRICFFTPGRRVEYDLKNRLLQHLSRLDRTFYSQNPSGGIISRLNNDINGVRMMMGFGLMGLFNTVATLSLAPVYMYNISAQLTIYCMLPIFLTCTLLQVGLWRLRRYQFQHMQNLQTLSDFTIESYSGLQVLKASRALGWSMSTFSQHSDNIRQNSLLMARFRAFLMPLLLHTANALKVLLLVGAIVPIVSGSLSIGGLTAYLLYLSMLVPSLMSMTFMLFVIQRGFTSLISLAKIFETESHDLAKPTAQPVLLHTPLKQGVRINQLSYRYPEEDRLEVLSNVNLTIAPGEVVGVFGRVGSGKTTLANLLNGHLQPSAGQVFIDDVDITTIPHRQLRQHVVTVTQEPFLFSETIEKNILMAHDSRHSQDIILQAKDWKKPSIPLVDINTEQLLKVVEDAALSKDVSLFTAGVKTLVGEKGITLSGGQKQRISLARSMLLDCDLLILDDTLSAVDHETERFLIDKIYQLKSARALLIISHRISVLEQSDRIAILEDGTISTVGTHQQLLSMHDGYASAWAMQSDVDTTQPNAI